MKDNWVNFSKSILNNIILPLNNRLKMELTNSLLLTAIDKGPFSSGGQDLNSNFISNGKLFWTTWVLPWSFSYVTIISSSEDNIDDPFLSLINVWKLYSPPKIIIQYLSKNLKKRLSFFYLHKFRKEQLSLHTSHGSNISTYIWMLLKNVLDCSFIVQINVICSSSSLSIVFSTNFSLVAFEFQSMSAVICNSKSGSTFRSICSSENNYKILSNNIYLRRFISEI